MTKSTLSIRFWAKVDVHRYCRECSRIRKRKGYTPPLPNQRSGRRAA